MGKEAIETEIEKKYKQLPERDSLTEEDYREDSIINYDEHDQLLGRQSDLTKEDHLEPGGADDKIAALYKTSLDNMNRMSPVRNYFDGLRMAVQTKISEKPPVFETSAPFVYKPVSKTRPWTRFLNPFNVARLAGNIITRAVTAIPLLPKIISYRGRQAIGAALTMVTHLANFPGKTAALIHQTRMINIMKKSIKDHGETELCNEKALKILQKERLSTLKNWGISAVAVAGVASAGTIATVPAIAGVAHGVTAAGHGLVGKGFEAAAMLKKAAIAAHEEGVHLTDLQKNDPITEHLNELEAIIKNPKSTSQERKMASAQQKRMIELNSKLDTTFMSHKTKRDNKFVYGTEAEWTEKVLKEAKETIDHHNKMKRVLTEHAAHVQAGGTAPISHQKLAEFHEAQTYAGKSGNR